MPHQAHDTLLRKLQISAAIARKHLPAPLPGLFVLTDPDRLPDPLALSDHLFEGSGLIYRHFGNPDRLATAQKLAASARRNRFTLLIGNDPELAEQVGADGVHWAEASLDRASDWHTRFKLMTAAAHDKAAMVRAQQANLDAALVSTVFPSASPSAGAPVGPDQLRTWTEDTKMPTYGLGGITADNFKEIRDFAGAAMIGAAIGLIRRD
jgi:thiamine-phosphate pyrophosphorylase